MKKVDYTLCLVRWVGLDMQNGRKGSPKSIIHDVKEHGGRQVKGKHWLSAPAKCSTACDDLIFYK